MCDGVADCDFGDDELSLHCQSEFICVCSLFYML